MKLVIIAAGRGSRLSSISKGIPKILIEVFNQTLLEHLIENCVSVGISDIVIVITALSYTLTTMVNIAINCPSNTGAFHGRFL